MLAGQTPKMTPAQINVYNRINRQIDDNNFRYCYHEGGENVRDGSSFVPRNEKIYEKDRQWRPGKRQYRRLFSP